MENKEISIKKKFIYQNRKTGMNYKRKINKNIGFQCFVLSRAQIK
jgi:hypothetical protein